jgi:crotonobetainyl-CoA:carnitine CoA-transferase CaiB-like acyl-CoA transferase
VDVNVPCSPINTIDQVFADPQVIARNMKIAMPHPHVAGETIDLIANPLRLSRSPVSYRQSPPKLGQHTAEVLEELLEISQQEMVSLHKKGVI